MRLVASGSLSGGRHLFGRVMRASTYVPALDAALVFGESPTSWQRSVLCCRWQVVREDKNLDKLRSDPRFTKLIDEYDEPVFNSGALK